MAKATNKKRPGWGVQSIGQKRPFTAEQIQLIRAHLTERTKTDAHPNVAFRDLALLELALSTCLRSVDLLVIRAEQIAERGAVYVTQKKTGRTVRARVNDRAWQACQNWVKLVNMGPNSRLWQHDRQDYAAIVKGWARLCGLNPKNYSTHSMRRTTPAHLYKQTGNVKAAAELLGHSDVSNTGTYLGIGTDEAHALAGEHDI